MKGVRVSGVRTHHPTEEITFPELVGRGGGFLVPNVAADKTFFTPSLHSALMEFVLSSESNIHGKIFPGISNL